jgi:hypothetical protein
VRLSERRGVGLMEERSVRIGGWEFSYERQGGLAAGTTDVEGRSVV